MDLRKKEIIGKGRNFYNEEDYILQGNSSLNIIGVIKPRKVIWTGHVAWIGEMKNIYKILSGKPEAKTASQRLGDRSEMHLT